MGLWKSLALPVLPITATDLFDRNVFFFCELCFVRNDRVKRTISFAIIISLWPRDFDADVEIPEFVCSTNSQPTPTESDLFIFFFVDCQWFLSPIAASFPRHLGASFFYYHFLQSSTMSYCHRCFRPVQSIFFKGFLSTNAYFLFRDIFYKFTKWMVFQAKKKFSNGLVESKIDQNLSKIPWGTKLTLLYKNPSKITSSTFFKVAENVAFPIRHQIISFLRWGRKTARKIDYLDFFSWFFCSCRKYK